MAARRPWSLRLGASSGNFLSSVKALRIARPSHGSFRLLHRFVFRPLAQAVELHARPFSVLFWHVGLLHTPISLLHVSNGSGKAGVGHLAIPSAPPCGWNVAHPKSDLGWECQVPPAPLSADTSDPPHTHLRRFTRVGTSRLCSDPIWHQGHAWPFRRSQSQETLCIAMSDLLFIGGTHWKMI